MTARDILIVPAYFDTFDGVLPEDEHWATGSLLDQDNVGKFVISRWNGNAQGQTACRIVKVTRTNVHIASYGKPDSFRVDASLSVAHNTRGGYSSSCTTAERLMESRERLTLSREIREAVDDLLSRGNADRMSIEQLRGIAETLRNSVTPSA